MKRFILSLLKRLKKNYKYYKSIDFLPLYNYFKIHETDDLRYLIKLKDYEELPKCNPNEFTEAWTNIQEQVAKADSSNNSIITFAVAKGIHQMELELLILTNVYNLMIYAPDQRDSLKAIKKAGYSDKNKGWVEKRIKALINKIKIKRKQFENEQPKKKTDFYQIIDQMEDEKGRSLDLHKTTVRQFIAIKKNINGRQNQKRRHTRKGN